MSKDQKTPLTAEGTVRQIAQIVGVKLTRERLERSVQLLQAKKDN